MPGESTLTVAVTALTALFSPAAGAYRGLLGITSLTVFRKTALEKAARARALCMVIRTPEWKPDNGGTLHNTISCVASFSRPSPRCEMYSVLQTDCKPTASAETYSILVPKMMEAPQNITRLIVYDPPWVDFEAIDPVKAKYNIHGFHKIPPGYHLCLVPNRAAFMEYDQTGKTAQSFSISYNYSLIKIIVSLGHAIYAIFTLYRARGDQVTQFGYAAFGLTVAPYAVVSVLNLLGSMFCPEFHALYMVESSNMDEARRRGPEYVFEGTVGRLDERVLRISQDSCALPFKVAREWSLQSIDITRDGSGALQARHGIQTELSATNPQKTATKLLAVGSELESHGITRGVVVGPCINDGIKDIRLGILRFGEEDRPGSKEPSRMPSSAENLILVPVTNPIRRQGSTTTTVDIYDVVRASCDTAFPIAWALDVSYDKKEGYMGFETVSLSLIYACLIIAIPIILNGALSRFQKGHSTPAQQVWTMMWLVLGMFGPLFLEALLALTKPIPGLNYRDACFPNSWVGLLVSLAILYLAPAIGGFIVVGQMLRSYGTCITVS